MKKKLLTCLGHAFVLVAVHILYYNMDLTMPLENEIVGVIGKAQRFFKAQKQFKDSGYVFVNTAYDNMLLNTQTDLGDSGTLVASNRLLLTRFFKEIADYENQHQYILCDLTFDNPSNEDNLLQEQILRVSKMILPEPLISEESLQYGKSLIFYRTTAAANYVTYEGKISKIRLFSSDENRKTLPLIMYENISRHKFQPNLIGLWSKSKYFPYSIYPTYYFS